MDPLDLGPSDYFLLLCMANNFDDDKFESMEACENRLSHFLFSNGHANFYDIGIINLSSKWQQVMEENCACLT